MNLIEIKNRFYGRIIFSHEAENNTDATTVMEANLAGADLAGADLAGASLADANLSGANMSGADLACANLSGADLIRANLSDADLIRANLAGANLIRANLAGADLADANLAGANLIRANLAGADLSGANLIRTIGDMSVICSMQIETFTITFTRDILQIGCKRYSHDEWMSIDNDKIDRMDTKALVFWKKYKDFIFLAIKLRFGDG